MLYTKQLIAFGRYAPESYVHDGDVWQGIERARAVMSAGCDKGVELYEGLLRGGLMQFGRGGQNSSRGAEAWHQARLQPGRPSGSLMRKPRLWINGRQTLTRSGPMTKLVRMIAATER